MVKNDMVRLNSVCCAFFVFKVWERCGGRRWQESGVRAGVGTEACVLVHVRGTCCPAALGSLLVSQADGTTSRNGAIGCPCASWCDPPAHCLGPAASWLQVASAMETARGEARASFMTHSTELHCTQLHAPGLPHPRPKPAFPWKQRLLPCLCRGECVGRVLLCPHTCRPTHLPT